MAPTQPNTAIVIIGRNEGARLIRCLESSRHAHAQVVYVDSASTDDSVPNAEALGAVVVRLDMSKPFSAARARNAGWLTAARMLPALEFVQFVDGDCEIDPDWIQTAQRHLQENPSVVAVCGRRKERHPGDSIYNLLCDLEWNTPCGEALAVGGDAMFRLSALHMTHGFRDDVVAGEEPELCVRLRALGGRIWRLDAPMTTHDANILTFKAWWIRCKRGGYAYALGQHLHGAPPERHWQAEHRRAMVWGAALPSAVLLLMMISPLFALLIGLVYPAQWLKMWWRYRGDGHGRPWMRGALNTLCKFAEAQGALKWHIEQHRGIRARIIEYK